MITIYTGRVGSGKSLVLADRLMTILERNKRYYKKTNVIREVWTNLELSTKFKNKWSRFLNTWGTTSQLIGLRDVDIFMEEIGIYFDAQKWKDTTSEEKRFFALHRHYGIDVYGNTQDFSQVDISVRRMTQKLYYLRKLIGSRDPSPTKPDIKHIWGLVWFFKLNPIDYQEDEKLNQMYFNLDFIFITKKLCDIYNTRQDFVIGKRRLKCEYLTADCGYIKHNHSPY